LVKVLQYFLKWDFNLLVITYLLYYHGNKHFSTIFVRHSSSFLSIGNINAPEFFLEESLLVLNTQKLSCGLTLLVTWMSGKKGKNVGFRRHPLLFIYIKACKSNPFLCHNWIYVGMILMYKNHLIRRDIFLANHTSVRLRIHKHTHWETPVWVRAKKYIFR